jgi:hypothetical protein
MLIICLLQGLYGRGHANADTRQRERFCGWHWELGCSHTLESNIPRCFGSDSMEILFRVCDVE